MFSDRIKQIREILGVSQSDFAKSLKISQSAMSEFENGARPPSKSFLISLKDFGISLDWFFTGQGEIMRKDRLKSEPTNRKIFRTERQEANLESKIQDLAREATAPQFAEHEKELQSIKERLIKLENRPQHPEELNNPFPIYNDNEEDEEEEPTIRLPVAENLAAGIPMEAFDTGESRAVPSKYLKQGRRYCVAVIKGTSMVDAGIPDGADVLLEYTDKPVDGAIMVVTHEGHTTLKRLHETKSGWELLYEDGSRAKIELTPGQWGVKGAFVRVL